MSAQNQNDPNNLQLPPVVDEPRRKLPGGDHLIHWFFQRFSPNVYIVYIGLPLLALATWFVGGFAMDTLRAAIPQKDAIPLAFGIVVAIAAAALGGLTVYAPIKAFWQMNWFAKIVTGLAVLDLTRWRSFLGGHREPGVDVVIAFFTCAFSEMLYNAWRSRKRRQDDEWA